MKGLTTTCLLPLIGAIAATVAFQRFFLSEGEPLRDIWPASIAAGICSAGAVMFLIGVAVTARERSSLRNAIGGQAPEDGSRVILAGRMKASSPLTSPVSGKPVAAYRYEMHRMVGHGRARMKGRDYFGTALAASTLETNSGNFRILTVPLFDLPASTIDELAARRNAQAYVAATHFQKIDFRKGSTVSLEPPQTDEHGAYQLDESETTEPDIFACTLDEWIIEQNAPVCVFGRYSTARGGIVADPNWAKPMRVMLGDADTVEASLGARIRNYLIGFTITGGIAVAVTCAYIAHVK
jgi:hypothetical protein